MRLFADDHMMYFRVYSSCQVLVPVTSRLLVAISPVSYFRCQILVVIYSVVRYQLSDYQLVLTSVVVGDISSDRSSVGPKTFIELLIPISFA